MGAHLNVKINCAGLEDKAFVAEIQATAAELEARAVAQEGEILALVTSKI